MESVAVVGATGVVGQELLRILEERNFPVRSIRCFASLRSKGRSILFRGKQIPLEILNENALHGIDLTFFCAGSAISKGWIPHWKGLVIDLSSAFRLSHRDVPLVVPEINCSLIKKEKPLIASPNCIATILSLSLAPLHKLFRIKRIVCTTFQAASGAGSRLLQGLQEETRAQLENRPYPPLFPFPYAFNLFIHNSHLDSSGYVGEEMKIREETRKILGDDQMQVSATCVRVPVLRAHAISANVEFHQPFALQEICAALKTAPGVELFEDRASHRFPTPVDATGKDPILCSRVRIDATQPNTLEFWVVGDQLRKGSALNAVQIAEVLTREMAEEIQR